MPLRTGKNKKTPENKEESKEEMEVDPDPHKTADSAWSDDNSEETCPEEGTDGPREGNAEASATGQEGTSAEGGDQTEHGKPAVPGNKAGGGGSTRPVNKTGRGSTSGSKNKTGSGNQVLRGNQPARDGRQARQSSFAEQSTPAGQGNPARPGKPTGQGPGKAERQVKPTKGTKVTHSSQHDFEDMDYQTSEGSHPGHVRGQGYGQGSGMYSNGHSEAGYQGQASGWRGSAQGRQDQMQDQVFREAQASKQMVYEVYGNTITMLEEMEHRELRKSRQKSLPRSEIYLPSQSKFDDTTIQRKLDTQLILLQAQLSSCHEAIKDEVKETLMENTLNWSSTREEQNIREGLTDQYARKLFGLLHTGTTEHPKEFNEPPTIDEAGMQKVLGAIVIGNQKRTELDKSFRDDRDKKATGPKMRKSAGIDKGADRIVKGQPQFESAVGNYRESLR